MRAKVLTVKRARAPRRSLSLPEAIVWNRLREGDLAALSFRRQHPIGPFILDFYCSAARLAVEIDGQGHGHPDQARHDRARDRWLGARGVRAMRIPAAAVLNEETLAGVLAEIAAAAAPSTPSGSPPPCNGGGSFSTPLNGD